MDLFDLHCDTASHLWHFDAELANSDGHVSLKKARGYGNWAQVYAIFVNDSARGQTACGQYFIQRDIMRRQQEQNAKRFALCATGAEMEAALAAGKRVGILSVENGAALGGKTEMLAQFAADGVRLLTLTWFGENELGFGSKTGGPLKPFGREVLQQLEKYGIVPDVSHLSDEGVQEAFALYAGPPVATHSNCRAVTDHYRNLPRWQAEEICRRGGLIGLNLCCEFLNADKEKACIDDVYRHASTLLDWGAEKALCSGSDFDGAHIPKDIGDVGGMRRVKEYFLARGMDEKQADAIFFGNARAFFNRTCAK